LGADVSVARPVRLFDGSFVRATVMGVVTDVDLTLLTRQAYLQQSTKAVTGTTSSIYYFPGIDTAGGSTNSGTGYGTLYVYFPTANGSTYTVFANCMRPLYDMTSPTDGFDFPQEWMRFLKYSLAVDMAPEYDVPGDKVSYLKSVAMDMHDKLINWNWDQANIAFGEDRVRQERARDQIVNKG
jgi:hypothetical protein